MSAECRVMSSNSALVTLHSALALNAERLDALPLAGQLPDEDRARDIDGREQVDDQTEHERDGEAANRPCAEDEQKERRDDGRHVRVNDRYEGAGEALLHGREHGLAHVQLFADALEDEHVRVYGHTK